MEFIETTEQTEESYDFIDTACDEIYDTLSDKGTCAQCGRIVNNLTGGWCDHCL